MLTDKTLACFRLYSLCVCCAVLGGFSCGPAKPPGGTVLCNFAVSDLVRNSANLKDGLLGKVHGSVYSQDDVTSTGPKPDAVQLMPIEVADVDLRTASTSEATWTSGTLSPGKYVVLGFFDLDGNAGSPLAPDQGDPVTLPSTNKFEIVDGQQTKRTVLFELVYNN